MVEDDYILEIFERAAGDPPSASVALEELRPRIRRAHRRRAAMRGSAALVVLVLLGGLVSNTTSHPSREVRVGGVDTTVAFDSTTTVAPSTTVPTPAAGHGGSSSAGATRSGDELAGVPGGEEVAGAQAHKRESATPAPNVEPTSANGSTPSTPPSGQASSGGAVTSMSASESTPSSPAPQTTSFDGEGGTIEVQYTETSMNLAAVLPSPGWSVAQTKLDGQDIAVSFVSESGNGNSDDINVHLDGGAPSVDSPPDTEPAADQLPGG
jgi:hypothetical protein